MKTKNLLLTIMQIGCFVVLFSCGSSTKQTEDAAEKQSTSAEPAIAQDQATIDDAKDIEPSLDALEADNAYSKTATYKTDAGSTAYNPYEISEILKAIAVIKKDDTSIKKIKIASAWYQREESIESSSEEGLKAAIAIFGFTYNSQKKYNYWLIKYFKTATPIQYDIVLYGKKTTLTLLWGYGATAGLEIQSQKEDLKAGIDVVAAKVQLSMTMANISLVPLGIDGPKISGKFSDVAGEFNVKKISSLYDAFNRIGEFEKDSTTTLTLQILAASLPGKETILFPDRPKF